MNAITLGSTTSRARTSRARCATSVQWCGTTTTVERALDGALRRGRASGGSARRWSGHRPALGHGRLRRVLARPIAPVRRPTRCSNDRRARLQGLLARRQARGAQVGGTRTAYLDVAWPEAMLGVEATSVRWHGDPARKRKDKQRDMWLKRQGWHIEYPTWEEAKDPDEFVAMLESIYLSRLRAPRRAS